jgi:hypothetical protein
MKIRYTFFLLWLIISPAGAQTLLQTITPAGGDGSYTGGSVSYTTGQVAYTVATGDNGSLWQGVQQPYEISVTTAVEEAKEIKLNFLVYPNPVTSSLKLDIRDYDPSHLQYRLLDVNGKLLQTGRVTAREQLINMTDYPPAVYFLKLTDNKKDIKTFRIIRR